MRIPSRLRTWRHRFSWRAISLSSSCWAGCMLNKGQHGSPWSWLCYWWLIATSTSLADMVWAKTDGDGVKLVVPSETVPEALASRKSALKWPFSVKAFVWKWKLEISCLMALVDVQATLTETLNVLPETKSVTEMVVFKLAERSFLSIWKLGLEVKPEAPSNCVFVQRSNWPIKTSAPLLVWLLKVF